jgi:hypothetical protein
MIRSHTLVRLANLRIHVPMAAMLPMLDTLDSRVLLQTDGAYIGNLMSEVELQI